jgi:O-antigen/teichoic acid export membrane protein
MSTASPEQEPVPPVAALDTEGDLLDAPEASRRVVRGSASRTAAYVAASLANAAVLPFLFRYLGVVRAGQYVTVVSLSTILAGIVETGLTGVSLRLYSVEAPEGRPALMRNLMSMRLVSLGMATALIMGFVVLAGYPSVIVVGLALCAVGTGLENVGSTYNVWLATTLRLGWIAISNVVRSFLIAALMLFLVFVHAPLIWFFVAVIPAGLAQMLVSAAVTKDHSPLGASADVRTWWSLTRSSASYVFAMALGFVYFRIPLVAMSILRPGRPTGLFGAAFRLVETLTLMTGFVLTAALPLLTRAAGTDRARHLNGVARLVEVSLILGAAMTVVTGTGASAAIHLLAGPGFGASIGILRLLSLVLVLKFLTTAWGFGLLSVGRYRSVLIANATATACAVAASLIAIPLIGLYGGALAAIGAELGLAIAYAGLMRSSIGSAGFPVRTTLIVIASALVAGGAMLLPIPQLAVPCVAAVVFGVLVLVGGVCPPEALELVPWLRRLIPG